MTYTIVWSGAVMRELSRLRAAEPDIAKMLIAAILDLKVDPRPSGSRSLGDTGLRRLRLSDRRILYEVSDEKVTVLVMTVGAVKR